VPPQVAYLDPAQRLAGPETSSGQYVSRSSAASDSLPPFPLALAGVRWSNCIGWRYFRLHKKPSELPFVSICRAGQMISTIQLCAGERRRENGNAPFGPKRLAASDFLLLESSTNSVRHSHNKENSFVVLKVHAHLSVPFRGKRIPQLRAKIRPAWSRTPG